MHFYYETFSTLMLGFYMMFWSSCLCYVIPVLELHLINSSAKVSSSVARSLSLISKNQYTTIILVGMQRMLDDRIGQ